jgi:hypothetical protein
MDEPAPKRAKGDINAQVRAAVREAERAEWIGNECEIEFLKRQADEITRIQPIGKEEELLLIIQQLEQKAARDRQKAAASANKAEAFTCHICMDRLPMAWLCVNVPCGHGFCKACINKKIVPPGEAAPPAKPECFNCRTVVASVVQTYV